MPHAAFGFMVLVGLALVAIAVTALFVALVVMQRLRTLTNQVDSLQRRVTRAEADLARSELSAKAKAEPATSQVHAAPLVHAPPTARPAPAAAAEPIITLPLEVELATPSDKREALGRVTTPTSQANTDAPRGNDAPRPAARPHVLDLPAAAHDEAKGLEEKLGTRLTVWVGAVALALAGAFLVKYSFEKGLLTPTMRVVLGSVFGIALIAAAEVMRRSYARIASGLAAAGVADLFAVIWAAVNLYNLLGPRVGFVGMAIVTAAAVLLSLRHGPFVALLGLMGGFATPVLVRSGEATSLELFAYLFALQLGLVVLTRRRGWWMLSGLTLLCSMLWAAAQMSFEIQPIDATVLGVFIIASAAVFAVAACMHARESDTGPMRTVSTILAGVGMVFGMLLLAALAHVDAFAAKDWVFVGILCVGAIVLSRLDRQYLFMPWVALGIVWTLLLSWQIQSAPSDEMFGIITGLFAALFIAGGYACAFGARGHKRPGVWASFMVSAAVALFLLSYLCIRPAEPFAHFWSALAGALALMFTVAAHPFMPARLIDRGANVAVGALAVGAVGFAATVAPIEVDEFAITMAWALMVPAIAAIGLRLRLHVMRYITAALAALVCVRLLVNPFILEYDLGALPIVNWILYAYSVPLVSFAIAAWLYRKPAIVGGAEPESPEPNAAPPALAPDHAPIAPPLPWLPIALEWAAGVLGFYLISLEIRHALGGGSLRAGGFDLIEVATYANVWLIAAILMRLASKRWPLPVLTLGGKALTVIPFALVTLVLVIARNPLWTHVSVGATPIANWLLYAYGLPAAFAVAHALERFRRGESDFASVWSAAALVLTFVLITLEVRQGFHGRYLDAHAPGDAEMYAYSAAWIVFGVTLLILGIVLRGSVLRWASLAVMLLAVGKVFLYDTRKLEDLYRVFSFLGLGVTLMLLGFLYQRFVFRPTRPAATAAMGTTTSDEPVILNEPPS